MCLLVEMKGRVMLLPSVEFAPPVAEVVAGLLHHLSTQILKTGQYGRKAAQRTSLTLSAHWT